MKKYDFRLEGARLRGTPWLNGVQRREVAAAARNSRFAKLKEALAAETDPHKRLKIHAELKNSSDS